MRGPFALEGAGGGGFAGDNFVGKPPFVSLVSKVSPRFFLSNLGLFLVLVHLQCPSALRDDENGTSMQYFLVISQDGGPMDKKSISLAKVSHN